MAITQADGVKIPDGDEVPAPLTAEERRALLRVEEAQMRRDAASSGKGRPQSALDQARTSQRPTFLPGARINTGPIASTPYTPNMGLDPRNVDHLLQTNTEGKPEHADLLASTRAAFDGAYKALEQISKARVAANQNESWTPGQQLLKVGEMSDKALTHVTEGFDKARKHLTDFITALDAQMSAPLKGDPFAVEIRNHVKALQEQKRSEFVTAAMKRGDKQVINAVLGAPAYLSGLGEAHYMTFVRQYREASNPVAAARLAVAKRGLELLDARISTLFLATEFEQAMGGTFGKLRRLRDANTAAEQALVMQSGLE